MNQPIAQPLQVKPLDRTKPFNFEAASPGRAQGAKLWRQKRLAVNSAIALIAKARMAFGPGPDDRERDEDIGMMSGNHRLFFFATQTGGALAGAACLEVTLVVW